LIVFWSGPYSGIGKGAAAQQLQQKKSSKKEAAINQQIAMAMTTVMALALANIGDDDGCRNSGGFGAAAANSNCNIEHVFLEKHQSTACDDGCNDHWCLWQWRRRLQHCYNSEQFFVN